MQKIIFFNIVIDFRSHVVQTLERIGIKNVDLFFEFVINKPFFYYKNNQYLNMQWLYWESFAYPPSVEWIICDCV